MEGQRTWRRGGVVVGLMALALLLPALLAQPPGSYNEREVKSQINVQDKGDIWVLDFSFKDPRIINVDVPGRGRKLVWYMWYNVVNRTGQPRTFIPDFQLVTTLEKRGVFFDEVLPRVQEAIRKVEDPTGSVDLKNSVTIASEPIPVTRPGPVARRVTGVAIWDDNSKDQALQEASQFSVFVTGLSNGWSIDDKDVVRRKTLQLNFKRQGDRSFQDSRDIRFVPPAEWLYRASLRAAPVAKPAEKEPAKPSAALLPPLQPEGRLGVPVERSQQE